MILGGLGIERAISEGLWEFKSLFGDEPKVGPNSIDVSLAGVGYRMRNINLRDDQYIYLNDTSFVLDPTIETQPEHLYEEVDFTDGVVIYPGEFILASAAERINCDRSLSHDGVPTYFVQHYDGRSTMARIGIQSHVSAGFGDYQFKGAFTLELINVGANPVRLKAGMRVGQVYFESVIAPKHYNGYDQSDFKPQLPRLGPDRF